MIYDFFRCANQDIYNQSSTDLKNFNVGYRIAVEQGPNRGKIMGYIRIF